MYNKTYNKTINNDIRHRLLPPLTVALLLLLLVFFVWMQHIHEQQIKHETSLAINSAQTLYHSNIAIEQQRINTALHLLLNNEALQQAFINADRPLLLQESRPLLTFLQHSNITHFYFHTIEQRVLLRVHQPKRYGDLIMRQSMQQAVATQSIATGIELGPLGTLTLRSVTPWYVQNKLIGYLELGAEINRVLLSMHNIPNLDVATLLLKQNLDRRNWKIGQTMLGRVADWGLLNYYVLAGCSLKNLPTPLIQMINNNNINRDDDIIDGDKRYRLMSMPINDMANQRVAELLLLYDISSMYADVHQEIYFAISLLALLGGLLLGILCVILGRLQKQLQTESQECEQMKQAHIATLSTQNQKLIDSEYNLHTHVEQLRLAQLASLNMMQDIEHGREVAEEALKAKSRFLAMMSHEIRTPLNGILGLSELLLDSQLNNTHRENIHAIYSSGHTLLTVLNDILDYSKMEANQLSLNNIPLQINDVVEHVGKLFAATVHKKGLEFACSGLPLLDCFLLGDPDRIQQILMNMVSNAVKFTEHGEIVISCTMESETDTAMRLLFSVSDTGIGIAKAEQKKLFEEFIQIDSSHTRQYGGTGLGLAISQRLVSLMGGTLKLESIKGKCSKFFFSIAMTKGEPLPDNARKHHDEFAQWRVLVVDDHPINQDIMHILVTSWGMRNGSVSSGKEALAQLHQEADGNEPYHLVLLDQMMPEMDGLTLAKIIKNDAKLSHLKLIMLSSLDDVVDAGSMLNYGLDGYLRKPIHQSALYNLILAIMSGKTQESAILADTSYALHGTRKEHILLVEDVITNQQVIVGMLTKLGFVNVEIAPDGFVAVNLFCQQKQHYDLILMDLQMPNIDGFEATRKIRLHENTQHHKKYIPIIALTAHAFGEDKQRAIAIGMNDYLTKPISGKILSNAMNQWLPVVGVRDSDVNAINAEILIRLHDDMGGHIGSILDSFCVELDVQLQQMQQARESADNDKLRRSAHRIKGSSANIGAIVLSELATELENIATSANMPTSKQLQTFAHAIDDVKKTLTEEWVQELR